jgi:curli production assembly/transport component CsgF
MHVLKGRTLVTMLLLALAGAALVMLDARPAEAQQLVFRPTNPAFGGNPMNQQWLLSTAQAQKRTEQVDRFNRDPIEDFQQGLQRQILSALSREIIYNRFGRDMDLTKEGRFDLGDFVIEVFPGLNGIDIRIINALTGAQTTVTVPGS